MITGFNTDVEHDGVVYHVQTEDKGVNSPLILSLVYVGGTILASKRTPYNDLIASGLDEKTLAERLNRQHRLICAAIHTGRIEDLKRQTERDAAIRAQPHDVPANEGQVESPPEIIAPEVSQPVIEPREEVEAEIISPEVVEAEVFAGEDFIFELGSIADHMPPLAFDHSKVTASEPQPPVSENVPSVVELPPEGTEVPYESKEFALPREDWGHVDYSQVVDYSSDAEKNLRELHISLLEETKYVAGEFVKIQLHVGRGWDGHKSVSGAAVTLKVLGSNFRPMIFSAKTLDDGTAVFYAMLPYFTSGRAAILISATDQDERAELRRLIHQS